jgi:hypothetical protein
MNNQYNFFLSVAGAVANNDVLNRIFPETPEEKALVRKAEFIMMDLAKVHRANNPSRCGCSCGCRKTDATHALGPYSGYCHACEFWGCCDGDDEDDIRPINTVMTGPVKVRVVGVEFVDDEEDYG